MLGLTKRKVLGLLVFFLITIFMSLIKVWVSIEKVDLAYDLKKLQKEYAANLELNSKLLVEKNNLLSPYRLKRLAEELGFSPPGADRVRRLDHE
jgi:cell division protein FtsL